MSNDQGLPNQSTPVLDDDGTMNLAWYRFFQALLRKSGLSGSGAGTTTNRIGVNRSSGRVVAATLYPGGTNASCAIAVDVSTYLNVYDILTGEFIGRIKLTTVF